MSDNKENGGFLRRVARLVAHPSEWVDHAAAPRDQRETEHAKSELKASMERKRRNDFVRKREFDMLRKVRREGGSEGLLGAMPHSNIDSDMRASDWAPRSDIAVRAKIDAIEQQMAGEAANSRGSFFGVSSRMSPDSLMSRRMSSASTLPSQHSVPPARSTGFPPSGLLSVPPPAAPAAAAPKPAPRSAPPVAAVAAAAVAPAPTQKAPTPPAPAAAAAVGGSGMYDPFAVEVSEVVHDPELDEVVIAFANADFSGSENSLRSLVQPGANRAQHPDTWLVLFDLYRATGQQAKFESLALEFARGFGLSAPQWFSLPRMVAETVQEKHLELKLPQDEAEGQKVGWTAPEAIDEAAVEALRKVRELPAPWVLDWSPLQRIEAPAVLPLRTLLKAWAGEPHEMRWLGSERLLDVLQEATPAGARDVDEACWLLRLEVLRLVNRPDQFDEVAIDYCVTYEVSPPSWTPSRSHVRFGEAGSADYASHTLSVVSDVSTRFVETDVPDDSGFLEIVTVELSGQLVGDISSVLEELEQRLGKATLVNVSCLKLIRVDFIAAGDLLNWVLARRSEGRTVIFEDAHRLLALFFGAMGITEHARVKVRNV